jgi:hypothetical protein
MRYLEHSSKAIVVALILVIVLLAGCFRPESENHSALSNETPKPASESQHTSPRLFEIGMSREEMIERFGPPPAYYAVSSRRDISPDEYPVVCEVELCRPIYRRRTAVNEYRIVIFETADDSQSRLHPTIRVKEIRFTLDKDMTPDTAVSDIVEAHALCAAGCQFPTRRSDMYIATANQTAKLWFAAHNRLKAVDRNTPISQVSIFTSKLR